MIDTFNNIDKSQNSYPKCKKTDQKKVQTCVQNCRKCKLTYSEEKIIRWEQE